MRSTRRGSAFMDMEYWYIDGESGLNTERVKATLVREGIQVKTRAPGQYAKFIEVLILII